MDNANGRIPLVILLVTRSHTKFLDDGDPFVPNLLSRMFPISGKPTQVDIAAAVVDQIPYPPDSYPLNKDGVQTPRGFEGFSVAVSYSEIVAPDLWSQSNVQKAPGLEPALERPVLSFQFSCHELGVGSGTVPQHVQSTTSYVLRLPVANTLFYNDRPSTMFASRWVSSIGSTSQNVYACMKKIDLAPQVLNLTGMLPMQDLRHQKKLVLELQPMTVPRVIAAGVGNIIRELYMDRESHQTMPASQELEDAISRDFKNSRNPDQRPGVWALITPRTRWVDQPQIETSDAAHWIERGSRLHEVLSGGGGWGVKKGLLALDPETNFQSPEPETCQACENDHVTNANSGRALEGVFKPGDIITFFRPKFSQPKPLALLPQKKLRYWHVISPNSICLGCGPSTADAAIGGAEWAFQKTLVKGHFGMLSEQGMSLQIDRNVPAGSIEQSGTIVHTKIDNPHAYFSIIGRRRSKMTVTFSDGTQFKSSAQMELSKQFASSKHFKNLPQRLSPSLNSVLALSQRLRPISGTKTLPPSRYRSRPPPVF